MPKAKSSRRKPSSKPSLKKPRKSSKKSTTSTAKERTQGSIFLTAAREIRDNVYTYFLELPGDDQTHDEERAQIRKTRKSLLSVCRQVSEEWAPIFYRTTTIIVHALKPDAEREWDENKQCYRAIEEHPSQFCNPTTFDTLFLETLDNHKRAVIRKLHYKASSKDSSNLDKSRDDSSEEGCFWLAPMDEVIVDFDGLNQLRKILAKYIDSFESLTEVVLFAEGPEFGGHLGDLCPDGFMDDSEEYRAKFFWKHAPNCGQWDEVARMLRAKTHFGVLRSFNVTKRTKARMYDYSGVPFNFTEVSLVFTKPDSLGQSTSSTLGTSKYEVVEEWDGMD